ncbi:VOC family protein [Roseomonas populi]|uniref:VOC family protein n=1 Tax=Roseomonas populi TaxID=3121582 RepID=A0ABT1X3D3_9PROT|nr:VOC family protein [Roseomonas pecuniae]MCR0981692.1 VOC family protein [Roseomonas pecuniae]
MQANAYLFFSGNCEEAFNRYQAVLGGQMLAMLRGTGTPAEAHLPPGWAEKILHACLDLGGTMLMGSDAPPNCPAGTPGGFSVNVSVDTPEEAERVFAALSEGGEVKMPIAPTFWAQRFGMLVDRYGTPWMVNCVLPACADLGTETAEPVA